MEKNQQLLDYVSQARSNGSSDDQIRNMLLGAGWQLSDIDEVLNTSIASSYQTSEHKPISRILFITVFLLLSSGVLVYYLAIRSHNTQTAADIASPSVSFSTITSPSISNTPLQSATTSRTPISTTPQATQKKILNDCGSISYHDLSLITFGNSQPEPAKVVSLRCFDNALLNCETNQLEVYDEAGKESTAYYFSRPNTDSAKCTFILAGALDNKPTQQICAVPKVVIADRSTGDKELLFFNLIGSGPSEAHIGPNDAFDPITRTAYRNICVTN